MKQGMEPSMIAGAEQMVCSTPGRTSVLGVTSRHEQIGMIVGQLRRSNEFPRNVSFCAKGVETEAWGFPPTESNRVLMNLHLRAQTIVFLEVEKDGTTYCAGLVSGEQWKHLRPTLERWERSGQYYVTREHFDASPA